MPKRKTDWKYRKHVTHTRHHLEKHPEKATCWLCGNPINMQLPPHHPQAFTLDHITPLARHGHLHGETRPAHRQCNSARGKGHKITHTKTLLDW